MNVYCALLHVIVIARCIFLGLKLFSTLTIPSILDASCSVLFKSGRVAQKRVALIRAIAVSCFNLIFQITAPVFSSRALAG